MKKIKLLKIFFFVLVITTVVFSFYVQAADRVPCEVNSSDPNCLPPTLGNLQTSIVSLIGTLYSMTGFLFLGILIYNGVIYLIGNLEDAKFILGASIEDAKKRMTQWLTGFLMVLISYPLVNGFMKTIVGDSVCYKNLNNPTVQFIFPEVCPVTDGESTNSNTTITPTIENIIPEAPVPQNQVSCDSYSPMINSIMGGINTGYVFTSDDLCKDECSKATTKYLRYDKEWYDIVYCNCVTNKCWSVVDK